jgi:hypothetical protein
MVVAACGGEVAAPVDDAGSQADAMSTPQGENANIGAVSFTIVAPSLCGRDCPAGHAVLAGAQVALIVRGLPSNGQFHARSSDPSMATIIRDVQPASCLYLGLPPQDSCGEVPGVEDDELAVATTAEGDVRIEILDESERVVGAITLPVRHPTEVSAVVRPRSEFLKPFPPLDAGAAPIEIHVGDGLFVSPVLYADSEPLAFYDGVLFTTDRPDMLVIAKEGGYGSGSYPGIDSRLVVGTGPGDAKLVVSMAGIEWSTPVRVVE